MSRVTRWERGWNVRASPLALKTQNPIRNIIENIRIQPNPDLKYITLSVGDPTAFGNLNPPESVLQAVRESIDLDNNRSYGPSVGTLAARRAVAEYSAHQGPVEAGDVILTSGCCHAVDLAVTTLAGPGQNILMPRPGHLVYRTISEGLGIVVKYYELLPDQQWKVDLADLERQIDERTAAIVVINPSNPCGSVYTKEHLSEIVEIASRNRVPILADEIYEYFVFSGLEYTALSSLSEDVPVITCSGITKRFLVPGWRVGWLIIHDRNDVLGKEVRDGLINMSRRILGPNMLIQRALPMILASSHNYFSDMMLFIENQATLACSELRRAPGLLPIMPQGSMYMMLEIKMQLFPKFSSDLQFVEHLVTEQAVLCLPGQCFGYPNFMRIVLTVPEHILREACARIIIFCEQHFVGQKLDETDSNVVSVINEVDVKGKIDALRSA